MPAERPYIVGMAGASGAVIGTRLIEELVKAGKEVHAVVTGSAFKVIEHEIARDYKFPDGLTLHGESDALSPLNSSSFRAEAMVVAPCSMKTLSEIAASHAGNLLVRAADGMLRTGRRLILVPRETPLSLSSLENMAALRRDGALIMPPAVAYYHNPKTVADITDFFVGKILDMLDIDNALFKRWNH